MVDAFKRIDNIWISDRFIAGFDHNKQDYYVEDKYETARYYRNEWNYHQALVTLLNDRQGYVNYMLNIINQKINLCQNSDDLKLLEEIKNDFLKYE